MVLVRGTFVSFVSEHTIVSGVDVVTVAGAAEAVVELCRLSVGSKTLNVWVPGRMYIPELIVYLRCVCV